MGWLQSILLFRTQFVHFSFYILRRNDTHGFISLRHAYILDNISFQSLEVNDLGNQTVYLQDEKRKNVENKL